MKQLRPSDTAPAVARMQIECFRKMTPQPRLQTAAALRQATRKLLAAGVRHRPPEYSEAQMRLAVIRMTIPEELFLSAYPHASEIVP